MVANGPARIFTNPQDGCVHTERQDGGCNIWRNDGNHHIQDNIQVEPIARSRIRDGRVKNGLAAAKLKWTHIASEILPDDAWI